MRGHETGVEVIATTRAEADHNPHRLAAIEVRDRICMQRYNSGIGDQEACEHTRDQLVAR
jgi:hypothetical protein